jgi:hypothetical protein
MSEEQQALNQDNLQQEQQATTWIDGLPEDVRGEKTLEKFKGEDGLAKLTQSYIGLEKKLGTAVWIPQEGAKPEEVSDFRKKLGIPESPDKYEIKYKEHEVLKYDENTDKIYKTLAHEIGLTPKQAQRLADFDSDRIIGAFDEMQKGYEKSVTEVKEEWGNDYQVNLDRANNVIRKFADEKDMEAIKRFENDPTLCRIFNKIGLSMSEHKFVPNNGADVAGTKEALQARADELVAIYTNPKLEESKRKAAQAEAIKIFEQLHGTKQVSSSAEAGL